VQKFPPIRVKEEYEGKIEICYPHNLGTNIIVDAVLKYGTDELPHLDSKYCDAYFHRFLKPEERLSHNWGIGNKPTLENWTSFLPADETNVKLPWFFSRDPSVALPLYYCDKLPATMVFTFKRNLSDLLRMRRVLDDGTFENMKIDKKYLMLPKDDATTLPKPELYGIYIKLDPEEVNSYKCSTRDEKYGDFYFQDIICCSSQNSQKFGSKIEKDLSGDGICNGIFWMAENTTSTEHGNISNYTTDANNLYDGYNPIEWTTLTAGGTAIFKELSTNLLSQSLSDVFPGRPSEEGILGWSFCENPTSLDPTVGVNMKDVKFTITCMIRDRDPFLNDYNLRTGKLETKTSKGKDNEYLLHVYLLVTKKITFSPASDKEDAWKIEFDLPKMRELENEDKYV
jgi:hypothetical protein